MDDIGVMKLAGALASHASRRQALLAENVANADTPGFVARDLPDFSTVYVEGGMGAMRATRPGHIDYAAGGQTPEAVELAAFGAESPNGNTVTLEDQMVRAAENQHQHELALGIYTKSLTILRTVLSRGQ